MAVADALADPTLASHARRLARAIRDEITADLAVAELETLASGAAIPSVGRGNAARDPHATEPQGQHTAVS